MKEDIKKVKIDLIKEYFSIDEFYNKKENRKVAIKIKEFIKTYGYDRQLDSVLKIIKIANLNHVFNYKEQCSIIDHIIENLDNLRELDIYDIAIFVICVGTTYNIEKSIAMIERIIDILDNQYSKEHFYEDYVIKIYVNFLGSLSRFHCLSTEEEQEKVDLKSVFKYFEVKILKICSKNPKYILYKARTLIRQGIFYANEDLLYEGFEIIEKHGNEDLYNLMELEKDINRFYKENILTQTVIRFLLGVTLRNKRKLLTSKTSEKMSVQLGYEPHVFGQVERGEREAPLLLLINFAKETNISLDELIKDMMQGEKIAPTKDEDIINQIMLVANSLEPKTAKVLLELSKALRQSEE